MNGRAGSADVPQLGSSGDGDSGAIGMALLDLDGIIVETNTAWERFCRGDGADPVHAAAGDSYARACAESSDPVGAAGVAEAVRRALHGDLPAPLSILVPCDSPRLGREFFVLVSARFEADGGCAGATLTISPIPVADPGGQAKHPSTATPIRRTWTPDLLPVLLRLTEVSPDETSLHQTLRRLADAAREVLGVPHAAVGISGAGGELEEFAHAGIDAHTINGLGSPEAVVGWFTALPHFLRRDVGLGGRQLATVYAAAGQAQPFRPDVERLAAGLIEAAGTAIENARAYQNATRSHRWAEAAADLTHELVSRTDAAPLDLVLRRALHAAEADLASILVAEDEDTIRLQAIAGGRPEIAPGRLFAREGSAAAEVMRTGNAMLIERRPPQIVEVSEQPMGPVAVVPLRAARRILGTLVVGRSVHRPPFTSADVEALSRFSSYAGLALELDRALADHEQLQLHDDRARIAQGLHEQVVRQLFAVGMGLEGIMDALPDAELRGRVAGYVTSLDESIRGIREVIYRMGED